MKQSMIAMLITVIVTVCGGSLGSNKPSDKEDILTTEVSSSIYTESGTNDNNNHVTQEVTTVETVNPTQETITKAPETLVPQTTTKTLETSVPQTTIKVPETTTKSQNTENLSFVRQVTRLVNNEREKVGLSPVTVDTKIEAAALNRAKEIEKLFSHTRPNGSSFSTVLTENEISFRGAGENIAWGQKSPEEVMDGWMNSSGHRANILNAKYTKIGVGYYVGSNGKNYWVQLFTY